MGYIFEKWLLVPLISITIHFTFVDTFTYQSRISENGRPILRNTRSGNDENNTTNKISIDQTKRLQWLQDLRTKIEKSVSDKGYESAKPLIENLVKETENSLNVLLFVKVARNGTTEIQFSPMMRAKKSKKRSRKIEASQWLTEFKNFVRKLFETYSRERGKGIMEYFIKSLESKNQVIIKDIDMDPFGNVIVIFDTSKGSDKNKKLND